MDQSSANYQKYNHTKNEKAGRKNGLEKERQMFALRRGKGALHTLNRTENTVQELSEKWPQKRKGKKRNTLTRSSIKVVKKKEKRVVKDRRPSQRRPQQSP